MQVYKYTVNFCFQNCLGLLYTVYIDNMQIQLETLVGNILGCVQVPPPGKCEGKKIMKFEWHFFVLGWLPLCTIRLSPTLYIIGHFMLCKAQNFIHHNISLCVVSL